MTKKIPVRIGLELLLPINILFAYMLYKGVMDDSLAALCIVICTILFTNYLLLATSYKVQDDSLVIFNGITKPYKIPISDISKLEKTWNMISSPAPGIFGRIEIYHKNSSIVISPKNYEEFKDLLLKINPTITIKN